MKTPNADTPALDAAVVQDQVTSYLFDEVSVLLRAGEATLKDGVWEMPLIYGMSGMTPCEAGAIRMDPKTSRIILPCPDLEAAREIVRQRGAAAVFEMPADAQALGLYE